MRLTTLERFLLDHLREAWEVHGALGPDTPAMCAAWVVARQIEQGIPARGWADGVAVLGSLVDKGLIEVRHRKTWTWYVILREASGERLYPRLRRAERKEPRQGIGPAALKRAQRHAAIAGALSTGPRTAEDLVRALDAAGVGRESLHATPWRVRDFIAEMGAQVVEVPASGSATVYGVGEGGGT